MVACPEETAHRMNFIIAEDVARLAHSMRASSYCDYLLRILEQEI